jgi:hypothetical protein
MNRTTTMALAALILMGTALPAFAEDKAKGDGSHKDRGAKMFEQADVNKDGKLTKAEMLSSHEKRIDKMFTELDVDKSGDLTKAELDAGREKMRETMKERWKDKKGSRPDTAPTPGE